MIYSPSSLAFMALVNFIRIYKIIVLGRVLISWVIRDPQNPIYRFFYVLTEFILGPIRSVLPNSFLDFSPIILYLLLDLVSYLLISLV